VLRLLREYKDSGGSLEVYKEGKAELKNILFRAVQTEASLAALRSQLVECEKVAEALKSRLDENSNGDLADYDAFDMYEAYKSAHPTEKG